MANPAPAWSYSSLSLFEQCPKKYFHLRVEKSVVDAPNEHNLWGNRVHTALEDNARNDVPLPAELSHVAPIMAMLKAVPGERLVEKKFGVTANLEPCDFFAPNVWYRGVIDYGVVGTKHALAVDHKTGKKKYNFDQLSLFAAGIMTHYPNVEQVRAAYLWLKIGELTHQTFTRAQHDSLWAEFIPRVRRIQTAMDDNKFPPKPSGLCGWCPVTTCSYWVKR